MLVRRSSHSPAIWALLAIVCGTTACESGQREAPVASMSGRRAREIARARLAQQTDESQPPAPPEEVPTRLIRPTETQPAGSLEELEFQVPDPTRIQEVLAADVRSFAAPPGTPEEVRRALEQRLITDVLNRTQTVRRPRVVELTLRDAIRRAVVNSYAIQTQAYNPAIDTTRVVEAEAQFDAVFFANFSNDKQDRPTASQLQATASETRVFQAGVRKLLSTGASVAASYGLTRTETNLAFQTLNPTYFNQFIVDFRQPLLRGFGLDFNRAQIELAKLDRAISIERLERSIRETIFNVEQAYWRLHQARRNLAITARLISSFQSILDSLKQRLEIGYDVYIVQVQLTTARLENRLASFAQQLNDIRNAEDALKRLINDPELNQAADIEIIPTDVPSIEPVVIDQMGELTAALQHREELTEARLAIEQAQIGIGVAKNQALPRLDLLFRYVVDGLGGNPDQAFSQLSKNDFHEYVIQLEFEWPIGNRGPEAALRRARLQQAQAIAAHRDAIENVISEVNIAIRDLQSNFDQIGPNFRSALASQEQLRATVIRAERRDPATLEVELSAHEQLATARASLLQALVNYNIALINLERTKGTLLRYNNIVLRGVNEEGCVEPYRPVGP